MNEINFGCENCNRQKSDSFDGRVVKGYLSKVFVWDGRT